MKVLVVIVSYNFEPWIEKTLRSLLPVPQGVEVLVVDNGSSDDTVSIITSTYPHVKLITNKKNLGFGAANNLGLSYAIEHQFDAVFLLNQDAWIAPNVLSELEKIHTLHPEMGVLSPVHLNGDATKLDHGFAFYACLPEDSFCADSVSQESCVEVPFVNAAMWWIPIAVIKKVGMFSSLFFHYGEDKDFVNRVRYHGYSVGYVPYLYGCHDREKASSPLSKQRHVEYVYWLSEYANVRYSFLKAFLKGVLAPLKPTIKALLKGQVSKAYHYLCMVFRLLKTTPKVIAHRQHYKQ